MTTVDSWWQKAGTPDVSVIKIDVEGAEIYALEGARECLSVQRPHVLLEWNRQNLMAYGQPEEALLDFSLQHSYRLYVAPHLVPIESATELRLQMGMSESFLLAPNPR